MLPFHMIGVVSYSNFVRKTHRCWVIRLQKCRDLENRVKGPWGLLKMSPFDRAHNDFLLMFYALSHVVSVIFNVQKYRW